MKCSWNYDFSDLIHRKMNYVFLGMIPILFSLMFQIYHEIGSKQAEILMGISFNSTFPIDILIYLWNVGFFLYLAFQLFTNQFHASYEYFLCRLSKQKWIAYKLSFILLVTLCYKIIYFLFLCLFSSEPLEELLILGGSSVLFTFYLQLFVLFLYSLWLKKKVIVPVLFLFFGIMWNCFFKGAFLRMDVSFLCLLCIIFPFFLFGSLLFLKNQLAHLFEGSS